MLAVKGDYEFERMIYMYPPQAKSKVPSKAKRLMQNVQLQSRRISENQPFNLIPNHITMKTRDTLDVNLHKPQPAQPYHLLRMMLVICLLLTGLFAKAQNTYTSAAAGNWNTVSNWTKFGPGPGIKPGDDPGDVVIINHAMVLNISPANPLASLTINASPGALNLNVGNLVVSGATLINGSMTDNSNTGSASFNGPFTVSAGGSFSTANTSTFTFADNIVNNGTFNKTGAGAVTFASDLSLSNSTTFTSGGALAVDANVTLTGAGNIFFNGTVTIAADKILDNQTSLTANTNLTGTNAGSTFINGVNANLDFKGATMLMSSGVLNASAAGNEVKYSGGNQSIKQATYHDLTISGTGTKTFASDVTINGSLVRTAASIIFSAGQTTTFESGSTATLSLANLGLTFRDLVINKSGGSLTIVPGGTITNNVTNLTLTAGSLNLGTTNTTLVVSGDLSGSGNLDMSGATHQVTLNGVNNSIGSLTSNSNPTLGTITYNRGSDQNIFGSPNYRNLTFSMASGTSKTLSLNGNVAVSGILHFNNNIKAILGPNDVKIKATGSLTSSAGFSVNRMFVTDGEGILLKEGTSVAAFTSAMNGTGIFPVGNSGGLYTPFEITSLSASIMPTASISVRSVPARQPNIPYYNNALTKYWHVETANLVGISANLRFTYHASEVIGSATLYTPRHWNGITLATPPGSAASTPFVITGTGTIAGEWSAADPTIRTTLYSYQSGDWNNANTWTTDPSGSTLISPIVPGAGDQVVILNGRTVTTAVARTVGQLDIQSGGVLDIGASSGHNFGTVSGEGTLKINSGNFPGGTFTAFTGTNGGTVEYYNLPAATTLSAQATYNNLIFSNSTASAFTVTSSSNMAINGHLTLSKTSSGNVTFSLPNAGPYTVIVYEDVTIGSGCTWNITAGATQQHIVQIHGNLTNNGTLDFQNGTAYSASTGRALLTFGGSMLNTTATFNALSVTEFYRVVMTKNDGFELFMSSSPSATVNFHGDAPALNPTLGTLRLGANLNVANLNPGGGNYDLGSPGMYPVFWIDGATVTFGTAGGAIVPYGTLKITAGTLNVLTGQQAVVIRESGLFQIDGGTVNMGIFRTSVTATTHRGSFVMTGGTLNINGVNSGEAAYYAIFSLPYPENVFKMSGGTMNITRTGGGSITPNGGILINSAAQNYDVSGGQINVKSTGNVHFDICSSAPFYNLNIGRQTAGSGSVRLDDISWSFNGSVGNKATVPAKPLVVLNNLTVESASSPLFNALGRNITVNGHFTVSSGATLNTGNNTITFAGNTPQDFAVSGTIAAPGLGSVTVNKGSASALSLTGSALTITATGNLNLLAGTLNDNGKTIFVAGNVSNSATHSGSGKISLNGTSQTVSGNGSGLFQNLEISGSSGTVTASNHVNINGNLNFSANRIFNISIYKLNIAGNATISSSSGSFGASRFIATDGNQSDGGIVKTFNSTAPFVFPFGTGSNYTPATIQFSATPGTWGALDVRPVTARQLYVTDLNTFVYYWKVRGTGFSGIPANSINHTFNYGNLTDDISYIPGYYNYQAIAFTSINDVSKVDEGTNNIYFTGVSYYNGDFTAGVPAAFGVVVPYYSRADGNWNTPATWSNTGHGGAASATIPTSSTPVFIGDGAGYAHHVTVTSNNTTSGSLIIDAGSVLTLGSTTGHNFGALPYSTAGGAGTLRISSLGSTAEFPAGDFGIFFTDEGGTTEYYTPGAQNFTMPLTTAAPTSMQIRTYKNLILNPGPGGTVNMPDRDLEIYQNLTVTGSGIAAFNDDASRILTVNGNIDVTGGTLRFLNNSSQQVNIKGNLSIGNSGNFDVANTGSLVHTINLEGNMNNNGTVQFNQASDVQLNFIGNASKVFSGTNGAANTTLSLLTLNKGNSKDLTLSLNMMGSFTTPGNGWLTLSNGTLVINRAGTITLNNQANSPFLIPATTGISLIHSGAVVNASDVNSNNSDLILAGRLTISAGTVNVGPIASPNHNDLEYAATGAPELIVEGNGILNVNGQIRRSVNVLLGSLNYTQRDNSTVLVRGKNPEGPGTFNLNRAKFEVLNAGSSFTMKDNALLIVDRSGQPSGLFGDINLEPQFTDVTGGEIRLGTAVTPASQTFMASISAALWNLSVDGTTNVKTVQLINNPIVVQRNLSVEGSSIFNANGYNVNIGGNLNNANPSITKGTPSNMYGGYRAGTGAAQIAGQVTTFNGSIAQTITGLTGNLTNFGNLVIDNSSVGGLNLAANSNIAVIGTLTVQNGNVNGGANNITVDGNIDNSFNIVNTTPGFFICGSAFSAVQTINGNGNGSFGNFRVNNPAGINMIAPMTINGTMNFASGLLYINNHQLTFGEQATVNGTISSASMIRMNGVSSDGGVRKLFPAAPQSFTFPLGITLKYTPTTIDVTSNSVAGSVTLKPVNTKHPATTDVLDKELLYYWNTTSTGFNSSTQVTHTYSYLQSDAINGNENLYVAGRYVNNVWSPQFGIPSSVNPVSNTITIAGVNYFNGDYTAGESSEFDQLLIFYSRNATSGGNWNDPNSWSTDQSLQHAGPPAGTAPSFNSVVIASGHTITATGNGLNSPTAQINGTLNIQNFNGHNFGTVTGTGKLYLTPNGSNQYTFPGGNFAAFVNAGGGTVEYYNNGAAALLPTQATYNNITFSGTGTKNLANTDLLINGNLDIQAGSMVNVSNKNVNLKGNFNNTPGISGFQQGTGVLSLSGAAQSISGATQFYRLTVNGAGVKTLNTSVDVSNQLTLTTGVISTGLNQLNILVNGSVSGGSAASYVAGNLRKYIASGTISKSFEVGDNSKYAPVTVSFTGTTNNLGSILASTSAGDHPDMGTSTLDGNKSVNRYWSLTNFGVGGFSSYGAVFNFNASDVDAGANYANFKSSRYASGSWNAATVGVRNATSTQVSGLTAFGDFILGEEYLGGLVWNGSISSDWNIAGNWTPNFVPSAGDDITIAMGTHQPSFLTGTDGNCHNIIFNTGTSLNIPVGFTLNVTGNWTGANTVVSGPGKVNFTSGGAQHTGNTTFQGVLNVAAGAILSTGDGITMASGANLMHGTGTIGAGGSITGQVKVQRLGTYGNNYNYWSSPIANGNVSSLGLNRYRYNPASASGPGLTGLITGWVPSNSGAMTVGRGYIATASGLASFAGTANNGNLSYGPMVIGAHTSSNLVGNPYPSNMSAAAFVAANPHINGGAIYLWDDDGSVGSDYDFNDFITWNGMGQVGPNSGTPFNGNIAVGQGFFVSVSNTNPVTFSNAMRTAGSANFFESNSVERFWVSVSTAQDDYNETLIGFRQDASDSVDTQFDALKMRANQNIAMYSMIGDDQYVIQALATLTTDKVIQLGIDAAVSGQQTFRLQKSDNLNESMQIILEDVKKGVFQNLRSNPVYQYQFEPTTDSKRFRLHLKPGVEIQTSTESCVQNDGAITINSPSSSTCKLVVRNQAGEVVSSKENFSGFMNIGGLASGLYTVKMDNAFGMNVQQVVEIKGGSPVKASISVSKQKLEASKEFAEFSATITGEHADITWNFGDGAIVTGITNPVHMYTEPGIYTVSLIVSNANCMDVKELQITVTGQTTGIATLEESAFSVYPNPVTTGSTIVRLNLKEREAALTLHLIDAAGRIVKKETLNRVEGQVQVQLQVGDLANGVYQLLVNGKTFSTASRITLAK